MTAGWFSKWIIPVACGHCAIANHATKCGMIMFETKEAGATPINGEHLR